MKQPILLRATAMLDYAKACETCFALDILRVGFGDNIIDKNHVRRGKGINDFYIKMENNEQTRALIELTGEHGFFKGHRDVIYPEG